MVRRLKKKRKIDSAPKKMTKKMGKDSNNEKRGLKVKEKIEKTKLSSKEKENLEKYGIPRCPECGSSEIVKEHGEIYCKKCGFVIDEGYE